MTTEQIRKLPQWAQNHIATLEMRLREAKERNDAFLGKGVTNVYLRDSLQLKPLPLDSLVRFAVGEGPEDYIDARIERGGVYIMATNRLVVFPESANTARLKNERLSP